MYARTESLGASLRDTRAHRSANVDHGALAAYRQATRHRQERGAHLFGARTRECAVGRSAIPIASDLDDHGADVKHLGQMNAIEVAHDLWDATTTRSGLYVHDEVRAEENQQRAARQSSLVSARARSYARTRSATHLWAIIDKYARK